MINIYIPIFMPCNIQISVCVVAILTSSIKNLLIYKKKCLDVKLCLTHISSTEKDILQCLFSRFVDYTFWPLVVQRVCLKPNRSYARILLGLLNGERQILCKQLIRPLCILKCTHSSHSHLSLFLFSVADFACALDRISKRMNR